MTFKMTIPKTKNDQLHAELRCLLAKHQISYKDASKIVGESYASFRNYILINRYPNEKLEDFIETIEAEIEANAKAS